MDASQYIHELVDAPENVTREAEMEASPVPLHTSTPQPTSTQQHTSIPPHRIPSLLELNVAPPQSLDVSRVLLPPTSRPRRDTRVPARYDSSQSFADSLHDADISSPHSATSLPRAPNTAVNDPQQHADMMRKKPIKPVIITNAALRGCFKSRRSRVRKAVAKRVTWAPRLVNCCALVCRSKQSNKSVGIGSEENASAANSPAPASTASVPERTRAPCAAPQFFTFEASEIAAFAHATAARDAHETITRTRATFEQAACQPLPACSAQCTEVTTNGAHESRAACSYKRSEARCESADFLATDLSHSFLFSRRSARSAVRSSPSATSSSALMDPNDAAATLSAALTDSISREDAIAALRGFDVVDVLIRGLDAHFLQDVERLGCRSHRDFLFHRLSGLPDSIRPLYEYAVLSASETESPARVWLPNGNREATIMFRIRVRSLFLAESVAAMFRREFNARLDGAQPYIEFVRCDMSPAPIHAARQAAASTAAAAPSGVPSTGAAPRADASAAGPAAPRTSTASALPNTTIASAPPAAGSTQATAGSTQAFGALFAHQQPLTFHTPEFDARAATAAAETAEYQAAIRADNERWGIPNPKPFAKPAFLLTVTPTSSTSTSTRAPDPHTESAPGSTVTSPNPFERPARPRVPSLHHVARVPLVPATPPVSSASGPTPPVSAAPPPSTVGAALLPASVAPPLGTSSAPAPPVSSALPVAPPSAPVPAASEAQSMSAPGAPPASAAVESPPSPNAVEQQSGEWPSSVSWASTAASVTAASSSSALASIALSAALSTATAPTTSTSTRSTSTTRRRAAESEAARGGKRLAAAGVDAEYPITLDSPENESTGASARTSSRLDRFAYDESRGSGASTPATLVIAEGQPAAESSALDESRVPTPLLPPLEGTRGPYAEPRSMEVESRRSPSPARQRSLTSSTETQTPTQQLEPTRAASTSRTAFSSPPAGPSTPTATAHSAAGWASESSTAAPAATAASSSFDPRADPWNTSWSPAPLEIPPWSPAAYARITPTRPDPPIVPSRDCVAVVVETNTYMFADSHRLVDIARRVVCRSNTATLLDVQIVTSAPTLLLPPDRDRLSPKGHTKDAKTFSEVTKILAEHLSCKYAVFYDRTATLSALRFSLPLERTFDCGRHILLRNDALRAGGTCWVRSRSRLIPLSDTWDHLIGGEFPTDAEDQAKALLKLMHKLDGALGQPSPLQSTEYVPPCPYYSHRFKVFELCESLLLEKRYFESPANVARALAAVPPQLLRPVWGSAPFRFHLQRAVGLDPRRIEVCNCLCRLVPHFGLALLNRFVANDVIPERVQAEMIDRQVARIGRGEREDFVFTLAIPVHETGVRARAEHVLTAILQVDDEAIAAYASMVAFPEFENVRIVADQPQQQQHQQ